MAEKKKSRKGLIALIIILVIMAAGVITVFSVLDFDKEDPVNNEEYTVDDDKNYLKELGGFTDIKDLLKSWSDMTEEKDLMQSDDVINFLIIGSDLSEYNSDVIMIMSLNKETKKVYLTSVMRDCYTYIPTSTESRFLKINASYGIGGAEKLIETVQKDFKIKIDHYLSVNFDTFRKVVDAIGGIQLNVPQYVAEAIGRGCPYGNNVTLNGELALHFVRIRSTDDDADISRTRRQREFINAVIDRSREVKLSQLAEVFKIILTYVKTDCSTVDLIKYATQGIIGRWYKYSIVSNAYPVEEDRYDYQGDSWVWIVDYPAAARRLQSMIYGKTNIVLGNDRVTAIDLIKQKNEESTTAEP